MSIQKDNKKIYMKALRAMDIGYLEFFTEDIYNSALTLEQWQNLANIAAYNGYHQILASISYRYNLNSSLIANYARRGNNIKSYTKYKTIELVVPEDAEDLPEGDHWYTQNFPGSVHQEDDFPPSPVAFSTGDD